MSNNPIKYHKDLISSFLIILLTDKQTGENITSLFDGGKKITPKRRLQRRHFRVKLIKMEIIIFVANDVAFASVCLSARQWLK